MTKAPMKGALQDAFVFWGNPSITIASRKDGFYVQHGPNWPDKGQVDVDCKHHFTFIPPKNNKPRNAHFVFVIDDARLKLQSRTTLLASPKQYGDCFSKSSRCVGIKCLYINAIVMMVNGKPVVDFDPRYVALIPPGMVTYANEVRSAANQFMEIYVRAGYPL